MDAGQLRFQATKPKVKWGAYLVDLARPKFGGGFERVSAGPAVVATNARRETRAVAVFKSFAEAEKGAVAIDRDFSMLGAAAWCERYGVPSDFVS